MGSQRVGHDWATSFHFTSLNIATVIKVIIYINNKSKINSGHRFKSIWDAIYIFRGNEWNGYFLFNPRLCTYCFFAGNTFRSSFPGWFLRQFQILDWNPRGTFLHQPPRWSCYNTVLFLGTITACAYLLTCYLASEFISVFIVSSMRTWIIYHSICRTYLWLIH